MTTATYAMRRNQNLSRSTPGLRLGPVSVGFVTIAAIVVLALFYLVQITKTSVFGYQLTELQKNRVESFSAKQELEVEAARLSSLHEIQSSKVVSAMVPEGQASYVKASN